MYGNKCVHEKTVSSLSNLDKNKRAIQLLYDTMVLSVMLLLKPWLCHNNQNLKLPIWNLGIQDATGWLMFVYCFSSQAVWFGCDVGKHFERKLGALHLNMWVIQLCNNYFNFSNMVSSWSHKWQVSFCLLIQSWRSAWGNLEMSRTGKCSKVKNFPSQTNLSKLVRCLWPN